MTIIHSLLDTDLYKFTMMQVVFHQFSNAQVRYAFKCRNPGVNLHPIIPALNREIDALCHLQFSTDELAYLRQLRFMKSDFIDFLELFQLRRKYIQVVALENGEIDIVIEGPWLHTILFEVPILAMVNELYFSDLLDTQTFVEGTQRLDAKIKLLQTTTGIEQFRFSDFGTRRRLSGAWQKEVVQALQQHVPDYFTGTSNVLLAKDCGLTPIGTMAHEYLQAFQALGGRLRDSQTSALDAWSREYRGDLGIALTDVVGIDAFLRDFDLYFCKLFDGVRHDSGDPFVWAEKMIQHYRANRIDPKTKSLVFSDGLDFDKAIRLYRTFQSQSNLFFGIGTHLTHDVGLKPLNVVIKMIECNGQPVAKLSDSPGKSMCRDPDYMHYLKHVFR
jgi:nicotinate phosphoribosyltransferase